MNHRSIVAAACFLPVMLAASQLSGAEAWRTYRNPQMSFEIALPSTSFRVTEASAAHLTLKEASGDAVIDVYAGANLKHLSPEAFSAELSNAGEIKDITYHVGGRGWFVVSGHYRVGVTEPQTIYYAKYLFSADLERVAGFEISYPVAEKLRMDGVVERLEGSFKIDE
jgi:hypothetical protein